MNTEIQSRNREIIRVSMIGIGMNLFLSAGKITLGLLSHAHAVMLDGINSLSDMASALLNIVCTHFGSKKADNAHPFGYGRLEYLSSLGITLIIMFIGSQSLFDTVDAIFHPHEAPHYSPLVLGIMAASMILKLCYGALARRRGKALDSAALVMSSVDSIGDAVIAASVLSGIVVYKLTGVDIEHYLCIGIALMILRSGVNVMRDCLNKILGTQIDPEYRKQVVSALATEKEVLNISNLIIHNYGEGVLIGSMDIEVRDSLRAYEISAMTRRLKKKAMAEGLTLTSVGITSIDPDSREGAEIWDFIIETSLKYSAILRVQAFECDKAKKQVYFDVVPDNEASERYAELEDFKDELYRHFSDFEFHIHTAINMGAPKQTV